MIAKTLTGIPFVDDRYGGVYRGRAVVVTGRSNSGKSVFGLQFLNRGIELGECGLLLSVRPAADVAIFAESLGMPIGAAVEKGTAIVLEYSDYIPGSDAGQHLAIPPEGFIQLQEIISANGVQRVVLDTCLPWISQPAPDQISSHVFSFIRSFDRLGATTMLTMPKPISPMAFKLKSVLEGIAPVAMTLSLDEPDERRVCVVNKYLGERVASEEFLFTIEPGRGIVSAGAESPRGIAATPERLPDPVAPTPGTQAYEDRAPKPVKSARARGAPVRFSSVFEPKWQAPRP